MLLLWTLFCTLILNSMRMWQEEECLPAFVPHLIPWLEPWLALTFCLSLAWGRPHVWYLGVGRGRSHVWYTGRSGRSQCIMGNGHMGTPRPPNRMTKRLYLPTSSFAVGKDNSLHSLETLRPKTERQEDIFSYFGPCIQTSTTWGLLCLYAKHRRYNIWYNRSRFKI